MKKANRKVNNKLNDKVFGRCYKLHRKTDAYKMVSDSIYYVVNSKVDRNVEWRAFGRVVVSL